MLETSRLIETAPSEIPSGPEAQDDRSMRVLEWALAGIALLVALALAALR
jgi:hypothetical protein